jgi:5-aminopentanamidase
LKVAAYQAPLLAPGSSGGIGLVRRQVEQCEAEGVSILCCPEAILGGLADDNERPQDIALSVDAGALASMLAPLASDRVTTIVGFTEGADDGRLYNSAAVFHRGAVLGVYRKLHPAINRSVYEAGRDVPVFQVGALRFGIIICNDSNFPEPARRIAAQGATVLFVPTNNGLPPSRGGAELVALARNVDVACAVENRLWVVRADVAGRAGAFESHGASGVVDPSGGVIRTACALEEDFLVVEIDVTR